MVQLNQSSIILVHHRSEGFDNMLNKQVKAFRHWFFNFSVLLNFFRNILYIWIPKLYQLTRYDKTAFNSKFNFKTNFLEYYKPQYRWHFPMHYAKHPSCHAHLSWTNNDSIFDLFWSFEHMLLWKHAPLKTNGAQGRGLPHNAVFWWCQKKISNIMASILFKKKFENAHEIYCPLQHWASQNIIFLSCFTFYIFTGPNCLESEVNNT